MNEEKVFLVGGGKLPKEAIPTNVTVIDEVPKQNPFENPPISITRMADLPEYNFRKKKPKGKKFTPKKKKRK